MEISVGNLHYHYPNKNTVILKLVEGFITKSDDIALKLSTVKPDANLFRLTILETFGLIHDYRFLFNERLLLSRKIPEVKSLFTEMISNRRRQFSMQIAWLKSNGFIRTELPDKQFDFLFDHIVILYNSWTSHISLLTDDVANISDLISTYVDIVSSIWIPYFTNKGLKYFTDTVLE